MKKRIILLVLTVLGLSAIGVLYAQQQGGQQDPAKKDTTTKPKIDYGSVEDESAESKKGTGEQSLYKITVDTFEKAGEWRASMPIEYGIINIKEIAGAPLELANKKAEKVQVPPKYGSNGASAKTYFEEETDEHKQVLGIKISYMLRGFSWAKIEPPFPVKLEGLVKGFEIWVCGRNKKHKLNVLVKDFYGEEKLLELGSLNFIGWKKMTVQIPYTISQEDFRYSTNRGLSFEGFIINFNPEETSGRYYIYFDNISVELSRFLEENRDSDDPLDVW